jgi:hypothetical protein
VGVVLATSVTNPCASQNGHCCRTFDMGVRFISDVALSANWMSRRGEGAHAKSKRRAEYLSRGYASRALLAGVSYCAKRTNSNTAIRSRACLKTSDG